MSHTQKANTNGTGGMRVDVGARLQNDERGVVLIIVAVVALGVLSIMLVLGIDSVRVQKATQTLRKEVDEICQNISERSVIEASAASAFASEMNALPAKIPHAEQFEARLLIPTTTAQTLSTPTYPPLAARCVCNGGSCADEGTRAPFAPGPITLSGCGEVNCVFEGDFCRAFTGDRGGDDYVSTRYPSSLTENLDGAGNVVGCEVTARVPSVIPLGVFGTKNIVARSMWRRVVRDNAASPPQSVGELPALTIGVAPYLTTFTDEWSTSPFNFSSNSLTSPYPEEFRTQVDPVTHGGVAFTFTHPHAPNDEYLRYPYGNTPYGIAARPALPANDPNDLRLQELRAACMNPAVLMRNAFLSTIAELAARTGELRNRTEILLANPRHSDDGPSPPALLVPFGRDLKRLSLTPPRGFVLPFVVYHDGNGFLDPFGSSSSSLFSGQLRVCYSLFSADAGGASALFRYGSEGMVEGRSGGAVGDLLHNSINGGVPLEDSIGTYARPDSLYQEGRHYQGGAPWDQECPWGSAGGGCSSLANRPTRPLVADEVLAALGSVQRCPIGGNSPCDDDRPHWGGAGDIAPDLRSLFSYVGNLNDVRAFRAPGLYKFRLPVNYLRPFDTTEPNPPRPYQAPISVRSHVLLVIHRSLRDDTEATQIRSTLSSMSPPLIGGLGNRILTVVYMPATLSDSSDSAIERLRRAFFIPPVDVAPQPTDNALFIFTPYDPKYQSGTHDPAFPLFTGSEEKQFADYWQYMLGNYPSNIREHIVDAAANIFFGRILKTQRKF